MKKYIVVLAALILAGCDADRSRDAAACEMEAWKVFPKEPPRVPNDWGSNFVLICMSSKGYELDLTAPGCSSAPTLTNGLCYVPRSPFKRWVDTLDRPASK